GPWRRSPEHACLVRSVGAHVEMWPLAVIPYEEGAAVLEASIEMNDRATRPALCGHDVIACLKNESAGRRHGVLGLAVLKSLSAGASGGILPVSGSAAAKLSGGPARRGRGSRRIVGAGARGASSGSRSCVTGRSRRPEGAHR